MGNPFIIDLEKLFLRKRFVQTSSGDATEQERMFLLCIVFDQKIIKTREKRALNIRKIIFFDKIKLKINFFRFEFIFWNSLDQNKEMSLQFLYCFAAFLNGVDQSIISQKKCYESCKSCIILHYM